MRPILLSVAVLSCLCLAVPARAQSGLRQIMVPGVEVRSGPGDLFYPTSKLQPGAQVNVKGPSDKSADWLEITPPTGSFSWINKRFLSLQDKHTAVVAADAEMEAPIYTGSATWDKKPNVASGRLKHGHIVIVLGQEYQAEDGAWLPIDWTPNEVRFIPKTAIQGSPVLQPTNEAQTKAAQTILQADQQFPINKLQARGLYISAAHETPDYQQRLYCYAKLNDIDKGNGFGTGPAGQPGNPGLLTGGNNVVPIKPALLTTLKPAPEPAPTAGLKIGNAQWSPTWGKLRRTGFMFNGQPMFALVDGQGKTIVYAVTPPTLTLDTYLERTVCLWGTVGYRSDAYLRAHYMNVTYVALPPAGKNG